MSVLQSLVFEIPTLLSILVLLLVLELGLILLRGHLLLWILFTVEQVNDLQICVLHGNMMWNWWTHISIRRL